MINMLTGNIGGSYKYLLNLVQYTRGDVQTDVKELSEQIKMRMEMGVTEIPDELKYTKEHEWALDNGDGTATVGITDYAQEMLTDIEKDTVFLTGRMIPFHSLT
jgi:hypothetical protein